MMYLLLIVGFLIIITAIFLSTPKKDDASFFGKDVIETSISADAEAIKPRRDRVEYWEVIEGMWGLIAFVIGVLTFFGTWIYSIYEYGFLLGVGLGWLPAIICAFLAGALWPLLLIVGLFLLLLIK